MLFATRDVTVKLLPFDNKSELQVVVDLPQRATLEDTERLLAAAAERLKALPELASIQAYAGTAAPFNFNGLVRHYYLRDSPEQGDLQVNLPPKGDAHARQPRHRARGAPAAGGPAAARRHGVKVVEVPPGPPVLATLLAEIYGPDEATRRAAAMTVREAFEKRALHRRCRRHVPCGRASGCASRSTRRTSSSTASRSRPSTTPSPPSSAA